MGWASECAQGQRSRQGLPPWTERGQYHLLTSQQPPLGLRINLSVSQVLDSDDALLLFLMCVCSSDAVCRQVTLTCRKHSSQRPEGRAGTARVGPVCVGGSDPVCRVPLLQR